MTRCGNLSKKIMAVGLSAVLTISMAVPAYAATLADNPSGSTTSIPAGESMDNNWGTITSNEGTLSNNEGIVQNNSGTVTDNWGEVTNDSNGTVSTNHTGGHVLHGSIADNYGTYYDATVTHNYRGSGNVDPNPVAPAEPAPVIEENNDEVNSEPDSEPEEPAQQPTVIINGPVTVTQLKQTITDIESGNASEVELGVDPGLDAELMLTLFEAEDGVDCLFTHEGKNYILVIDSMDRTEEQILQCLAVLNAEPDGKAGPFRLAEIFAGLGVYVEEEEASADGIIEIYETDDTDDTTLSTDKVNVQSGKSKLTYSIKGNTVTLTKVTVKGKAVKIPDKIKENGKTYKVIKIAPNTFKGNKKITKITIGGNVKQIGESAFEGCTGVKKVVINAKSLKKVGKKAFSGIPENAVIEIKGNAKQKAKVEKLIARSTY